MNRVRSRFGVVVAVLAVLQSCGWLPAQNVRRQGLPGAPPPVAPPPNKPNNFNPGRNIQAFGFGQGAGNQILPAPNTNTMMPNIESGGGNALYPSNPYFNFGGQANFGGLANNPGFNPYAGNPYAGTPYTPVYSPHFPNPYNPNYNPYLAGPHNYQFAMPGAYTGTYNALYPANPYANNPFNYQFMTNPYFNPLTNPTLFTALGINNSLNSLNGLNNPGNSNSALNTPGLNGLLNSMPFFSNPLVPGFNLSPQ